MRGERLVTGALFLVAVLALVWVAAGQSVGWVAEATADIGWTASHPQVSIPAGVDRPLATTLAPPPTAKPFGQGPPADVLRQLIVGAAALVVALMALMVTWWLVGLRRRRTFVWAEPDDPLEPLIASARRQIADSADDYRRRLSGGTPRNGIVAAWVALEETLARLGAQPLESDTSTEFTERVLGAWRLDPSALQELAALFREARFSDHEMSEDERQRAATLLEVLLASAVDHPAGRV